MASELARVLDGLRAAGVLTVPFKGPAFAALIGQGTGSREMTDLDLLIRPSDVLAGVRALAPLGYAPTLSPQALASSWLTTVTSELALLGHHDTMLIELHWQLSPHWYPAPGTVDDVMARLTERDFLDSRIHWPAAEELLLIHVADGMKSCGNGLRWMADIAQVLRRHADLDWARVGREAAGSGGLNSVRVALAVVEDLSRETALMLNAPALAVVLPPAARGLADDARRVPRLAQAVRSIRERLSADVWVSGAVPHFLWALRLADHPARVARAIVRYLGEPMVVDLAAMPSHSESGARLRWHALRRRVVTLFGD